MRWNILFSLFSLISVLQRSWTDSSIRYCIDIGHNGRFAFDTFERLFEACRNNSEYFLKFTLPSLDTLSISPSRGTRKAGWYGFIRMLVPLVFPVSYGIPRVSLIVTVSIEFFPLHGYNSCVLETLSNRSEM